MKSKLWTAFFAILLALVLPAGAQAGTCRDYFNPDTYPGFCCTDAELAKPGSCTEMWNTTGEGIGFAGLVVRMDPGYPVTFTGELGKDTTTFSYTIYQPPDAPVEYTPIANVYMEFKSCGTQCVEPGNLFIYGTQSGLYPVSTCQDGATGLTNCFLKTSACNLLSIPFANLRTNVNIKFDLPGKLVTLGGNVGVAGGSIGICDTVDELNNCTNFLQGNSDIFVPVCSADCSSTPPASATNQTIEAFAPETGGPGPGPGGTQLGNGPPYTYVFKLGTPDSTGSSNVTECAVKDRSGTYFTGLCDISPISSYLSVGTVPVAEIASTDASCSTNFVVDDGVSGVYCICNPCTGRRTCYK